MTDSYISRRAFLTSGLIAAAGTVSGCAKIGKDSKKLTGIEIQNGDRKSHTIEIIVHKKGGGVVFWSVEEMNPNSFIEIDREWEELEEFSLLAKLDEKRPQSLEFPGDVDSSGECFQFAPTVTRSGELNTLFEVLSNCRSDTEG